VAEGTGGEWPALSEGMTIDWFDEVPKKLLENACCRIWISTAVLNAAYTP
jgi:hypothetical protein